jgi:hypothetical protein
MSQDRIAELERENERLKQVCNCDLSNSAGVTIAGGRHSCGRIFVGSRVKELEAEVARLKTQIEYEYIPRFECPKCGGHSYHDDHDDLSAHGRSGPYGEEPECVSCPVNRCDACQEIMIEPMLRLSEKLGSAVKALNGLVAFTKSIDIFIGSYQGVVFDIESVKASRNQALVVAQDCLTSLSKGQP